MSGINLDAIDAYPLDWPDRQQWPRTENPKRSNFYKRKRNGYGSRSRTVAESREFLLNEIDRLGAKNPIISTNIKTRKDGLPYSNAAEPDDSGVAVYFELDGNPRCIPCDKWDKVADNIYAIGKTIEALRGIDRWGTPQIISAAFSGFKALPESGSGFKWWEVLDVEPDARGEEIKRAFKRKAKQTHPDRNPDDPEAPRKFQKVQEAYQQAKAAVDHA